MMSEAVPQTTSVCHTEVPKSTIGCHSDVPRPQLVNVCQNGIIGHKKFQTTDMTVRESTAIEDVTVVQQVSPTLYRVCPPASEMGALVQKNLPCPVIGCLRVCPQASSMRFHLEKSHKIFQLQKKHPWQVAAPDGTKPTVHWHCPIVECRYHISQDRHFTVQALVKQHFGRMHKVKNLSCDKCDHKFGVEKDLRRHLVSCGQTDTFVCTCSKMYTLKVSYMMHCSRKGHPVRPEYCTPKPADNQPEQLKRPKSSADMNEPLTTETCNRPLAQSKKAAPPKKPAVGPRMVKPILPTPNTVVVVMTGNGDDTHGSNIAEAVPRQLIYVADARSSEATNTIPKRKHKTKMSETRSNGHRHVDENLSADQFDLIGNEMSTGEITVSSIAGVEGDRKPPRRRAPKLTAGTQTPTTKRKRTVAETQTTGDFILQRALKSADLPIQRESKGSQVSPRAKVKRSHSRTVQSTETQTPRNSRHVHKRRRRKHVSDCEASSVSLSSESGLQGGVLSVPDGWLTDTQTQTIALLDGLQASLRGESISTQTLDSFLIGDTSLQQFPANGLANTMDQAILCDLGLTHDLGRLPSVVNASTSPRARTRSSARRVDCGTDTIQTEAVNMTAQSLSALSINHFLHQGEQGNMYRGNVPLLSIGRSSMDHSTMLQRSYSSSQSQPILDLDIPLGIGKPPHMDRGSNHVTSPSLFNTSSTDTGSQSLFNNATSTGIMNSATSNLMNSATTSLMNSANTSLMNSATMSLMNSATSNPMNCATSNLMNSATMNLMNSATSPDETSFLPPLDIPLETDLYDSSDINAETQTLVTHLDFPEFLTSGVQTLDFDPSYMTTETQAGDGYIMDLVLNNTQTQTTDDFLADLSFSDIETQTHISAAGAGINLTTIAGIHTGQLASSVAIQTHSVPAIQQMAAPSVGIQTVEHMSHGATPSTDTQTQTLDANADLIFPDLSDSYTQTGFNDLESFVDTLNKM